MSLDEPMRYRIHTKLSELMGTEEADAMMANWLPWREVATRDDLRVLSAEVHTDMAELRTELRTDMAELRTELRTDMAELRTDMAELRSELRTDMAELRTEFAGLRNDMHVLVISQTRWILGYITVLAAAVVAAAQLLG